MELRELWRILYRRWWLPAALTVLTGIFTLIQLQPWQPQPPSYVASMRLLVGVMPASDIDEPAYDPRYYAWLTSEYLVDDFTEVVRSALFARNVSARLANDLLEIPAGLIQGSAVTGKQHRIISLSLTWGDVEQLHAIADAATAELVENATLYFQQLGTNGAGVTLLDGPDIVAVGPGVRDRIELPLRVGLALLVGIGLAFFLDYLDTSIRNRSEVEDLGLHVLGEIPKHR